MSHLIWLSHTEPGHCVLSPTRIKKVGRLYAGEQVPADFGQPIQYRMSDLFPDDIALSDNYEKGQVIVSARLRAALTSLLAAQPIQYLPAKIINHKGRVAAEDYAIVHPHTVLDAIDIEASKVDWSELAKDEVDYCAGLVLKPLPEDAPPLFRLKHWGSVLVVTTELAQKLQSGGFVGLRFLEPQKYTGRN
jgi:hypothetical protein